MRIFLLSAVFLGACATAPVEPLPDPEALRPVLGPGDLVEIRVFGEDDLTGDHRVSPEGTLRLPLIGRVELNGLSPDAAAEKIAELYETKYLRNAQVTVNVKEYNSRKIFILGQVKSPGSYPFEDQMTVIAAIARAGGTNDLANLNATIITRAVKGAEKRIEVAVGEIRRGQKPDVALRPGDIIFVPETWF